MEEPPQDETPHQSSHVFLSPEVIEIHLAKGEPLPAGTAKLLWVLQQLFNK